MGFENINITTDSFDSFLNINTKEDFEKAKKKLDKIWNDFLQASNWNIKEE